MTDIRKSFGVKTPRIRYLGIGAALLVLGFMLPLSAPARAMDDIFAAQQDAVENPGGGNKVVTPLKDCVDKLPPEEAAAVRSNYLKPYQECITRLRALQARGGLKKEPAAGSDKTDTDKTEGKTDGKNDDKPAENARNFVRVRPDDGPRLPAQSYGEAAEPAAAPSRPAWDSGYNR